MSDDDRRSTGGVASATSRSDDLRSASAGRTVRLLIDHDENRRMLGRALAEEYAVDDAPPGDVGDEFDVCIVDARAFERHHEALAARKRQAEPVFLPYLFLTDAERVSRLPDAVWDAIDEVMTTPLAPAELRHRLDNLLERRRLSVDLERRKERSERRFEALFDTAPDPIVVTSPDGNISEVNDAFAATVGERRSDLVGRSITDVGFAPTEAVERVLLRVVESADDDASESRSVRLDVGGEKSLVTELNADVVTALGGSAERIGIFRDVTERDERETELRQQNERLKGFASTIAHDLRNPLTIARGHLELARDDGDSEHFDAVDGAHDRMEQLIDEILTLARQGQLVMDPEPVSLDTVARLAWENVGTERATLSVENEDVVLADKGRLCECFENLFRNAVEHGATGDGAVSVHVGATETDDDRGFYVADDGSGVPEADRSDVFEAGYSETDQGTGFGLSIVRQIAEGHDWDVSVTESDAGGARFEFVGIERP